MGKEERTMMQECILAHQTMRSEMEGPLAGRGRPVSGTGKGAEP